MTLSASGQISLGGGTTNRSVSLEFRQGATSSISLNDGTVRALAEKPTGQISLNDLHNKTYFLNINLILSGGQNPPWNLYTLANNLGYYPGQTHLTITINTGSSIGSIISGNGFALDTGTGWSGNDTITIYNYGTIFGRGGSGGFAGYSDGTTKFAPLAGTPGEPAIKFQWPTTVYNYGIIAAGGGGGGATYPIIGFNSSSGQGYYYGCGVHGGGGAGYGSYYANFNGITWPTAVGGDMLTGGAGQYATNTSGIAGLSGGAAGGGGGPGVGGGIGYNQTGIYDPWPSGGGGGGAGASGGAGGLAASYTGYLVGGPGSAGGAGGNATIGANTFVTWAVTGTRYGTIA